MKNESINKKQKWLLILCLSIGSVILFSPIARSEMVCPSETGFQGGEKPALLFIDRQGHAVGICGYEESSVGSKKFMAEFQVIDFSQNRKILFVADALQLFLVSVDKKGFSLIEYISMPVQGAPSFQFREGGWQKPPFRSYTVSWEGTGFKISPPVCAYNFRPDPNIESAIIAKLKKIRGQKGPKPVISDEAFPYELLAASINKNQEAREALLNAHILFSADGAVAEAFSDAHEIYKAYNGLCHGKKTKNNLSPSSQLDQQSVFVAEEGMKNPVSIPEDVLHILRHDERVQESLGEKQAVSQIIEQWFSASSVYLNNDDELPDLVVMATEPRLLGANVVPFWVFQNTPYGNKLVLVVNALGLEILNTTTNNVYDIRTSVATATEVLTTVLKFQGKEYRSAPGRLAPIKSI